MPVETAGDGIAHPDDFWETDGELLLPADSPPTQSLAAPAIPTQSSQFRPPKTKFGQSKPIRRATASPTSQNKLIAIIVSSSLAVLCLLGVAVYIASTALMSARAKAGRRSLTVPNKRPPSPKPEDAAANRPGPTDASPMGASQSVRPRRSRRCRRVRRFSTFTCRLLQRGRSVNNPAVEVSGSGSRRRVVVSDPRTIRSITLNLAADGYEGRHEELATQPGPTTSFRLALVRSQPNGFVRPTAENQTKAQTSSSDGFRGPSRHCKIH